MMQLVFTLFAVVVALALLAAAFVYIVDPSQARRLLEQLRLPLVTTLAALATIAMLHSADFLSVVVGLTTLSAIAYFVRERGKPKRQTRQNFGGAERKPVLPSTEPTADTEPSEEKEQRRQ